VLKVKLEAFSGLITRGIEMIECFDGGFRMEIYFYQPFILYYQIVVWHLWFSYWIFIKALTIMVFLTQLILTLTFCFLKKVFSFVQNELYKCFSMVNCLFSKYLIIFHYYNLLYMLPSYIFFCIFICRLSSKVILISCLTSL
jgi:hypothetical protein